MRFHLTKIIEDRSPVVVSQALQRCLKGEAWEIKRHEKQIVALGIGTSRTTVNLADKAIFEIDSSADATTVEVEAEYQYTWFLSEESQNDTVRSRFESVFANMRAELDLAPESFNPQNEPHQPPAPSSDSMDSTDPTDSLTPSETSSPATESSQLPTLHEEIPVPTQQTSVSEVTESSTASPITLEPHEVSASFLRSSDLPRRPPFDAVSLIAASLIAVLGLGFGFAHFKSRPLTGSASRTAPSIPAATPKPLPPPDNHHWPIAPLPAIDLNPSGAGARPDPQQAARSEDLRRWLEQWAASERTRDAKAQASFYADDVRPYLTLDRATRDVVYQQKQNSIQNRTGLWTFKIENIFIKTESAEEASVLLKKIEMTQTDSVRVSERRTSSFLTLKRKQDGWQITGERDLGNHASRQ
jgi:ketosteroid isomerase-like protein